MDNESVADELERRLRDVTDDFFDPIDPMMYWPKSALECRAETLATVAKEAAVALARQRQEIAEKDAELGRLNRHVFECDEEDERLRAELDRYREALRASCIDKQWTGGYGTHIRAEAKLCEQCGGVWPLEATEVHAPGCLAAPIGEQKNDVLSL